MGLRGYIDGVIGGELVGWALDEAAPERRLHVRGEIDGVVIGTVQARAPRRDLVTAGFGDGGYGFRIPLDPGRLTPGRHVVSAVVGTAALPLAPDWVVLDRRDRPVGGVHLAAGGIGAAGGDATPRGRSTPPRATPASDPTHAQRLHFLSRHVAIDEVVALEIGAADLPTYQRGEADISFLDLQSQEALTTQYESVKHRDPSRVVPIDYVSRGQPLQEVVDKQFSLIIANHVLEHVPDVIGWLDELAQISVAGGMLFLAIPDRRYTFDFVRRDTDLVDLLEARAKRATAPDFFIHLRNAYYYRPIRAPDVWEGRAADLAHQRRFDIHQAIEHARSGREQDADMHSHVFTYDSFLGLWRELEEGRLVGWELVASRDVDTGGNEFVVLLARAGAPYDPDPLA